eukprot:4456_1
MSEKYLSTECKMMHLEHQENSFQMKHNEISVHRVNKSHRLKSFAIFIKNKQLFERDQYIKLQDIDGTLFANGTTEFYDNLKLMEHDQNVIISLNKEIDSKLHEEILSMKFILFYDIEQNEMDIKEVDSDYQVSQFNEIKNLHFTIPWHNKMRSKNVGIYCQLADEYFVLFKIFQINRLRTISKNNVHKEEELSIFEQHVITFTSPHNRNTSFDCNIVKELWKTHSNKTDEVVKMKHDNYQTDLSTKTYYDMLKSFIAWTITLKCSNVRCEEKPQLCCFCDRNAFPLYIYHIVVGVCELYSNNDYSLLKTLTDTTKTVTFIAISVCDMLPEELKKK